MDRLGRGRGEARDLDFDGRPEFVQTLSDDRGLRFIQLSWMERDSTVGLMRSDLALSVGDSLLAFTTFHTDNLYFPAQVAVLRSSFGPSLSAELFEGHVWVGSSSISGVEGYGLAAADYEGDGDDDIIVDSTYNTVEIYLQQDGYFSGAREAVVVSTTFMGTGHRIDGADIDGDGAMELAMTTSVAIEVVMEP
jgi:FG-GAP-like repeat